MDPREKGPKPPHAKTSQEYPGTEAEMDPKPDYGAESYKGTGKLTGKAAVITGGDSGIGRAVALAFAREGADVLISYLSEEADAREIARVVEAAGRGCVAVAGDITEEAHCGRSSTGRSRSSARSTSWSTTRRSSRAASPSTRSPPRSSTGR